MEDADYKVFKCREKYEDALDEMMKYQPNYLRNMTTAFYKCQQMEKFKLQFYKICLQSLHRSLDVTQNDEYDLLLLLHWCISISKSMYFCLLITV